MGCVKPMAGLLPFKANTAKQSPGAGRGRASGLPVGSAPRPKQRQTRHTGDGERQQQQYYMIGFDGSQSASKSGGVIIDCFFCSLVLIGGGWWGGTYGGENKLLGDRRCSTEEKKYNLICSEWVMENFNTYVYILYIKMNEQSNKRRGLIDDEKKLNKHVKGGKSRRWKWKKAELPSTGRGKQIKTK